MKIKNISKLLIGTILLSNINLPSFAGVLSDDRRYETFEGNSITIDNVLEEDEVDLEIEGNTLLNLHDCDNYNLDISINGDLGNLHVEKTEKCIRATTNNELFNGSTSYMYVNLGTPKLTMLKPDTTYTVVGDVIKNVYSIGIMQGNTGNVIAGFNRVSNNMAVVKTKEQLPSLSNQIIYGYLNDYTSKPIDIEVKNVMLLEGDWTNKEIPEYFEGIQSGFEKQLVTQSMIDSGADNGKNLGKYKVSVQLEDGHENVFDGELEQGNIDITTGKYVDSSVRVRSSNYIYVGDGKNVLYMERKKVNGNFGIRLYDENKNYISCGENFISGMAGYIPLREGTRYIKFIDETNDLNNEYKISLNVRNVDTLYLSSPLLIGDSIKYVDSKLYHVKNSKQIILDGNESWYMYTGPNYDENDEFFGAYTALSDSVKQDFGISDRFLQSGGSVYYRSREGVWVCNNSIYVMLKKSRLSSLDINGVKKWFSENPTSVVCSLTTPIYEFISDDLRVNLFKNTSTVSNNSNIPANMKVTVDRAANRAQEAVGLAKINPTVENLSQARYWTNLLKESTLKDSFQSEVNNITDIEDLTIEKKTTSANVDMYIKMKNSLSLSLDTNSITFENFNASEDLEMVNAVNLTVSSSLPYKVNACLESELYNSDKSAMIDKSVLNIKNSSDTEYKAFNDVLEPLLLLDNQIEGDSISHSIDLILKGGNTHKADVYKTTIKFEVEQK